MPGAQWGLSTLVVLNLNISQLLELRESFSLQLPVIILSPLFALWPTSWSPTIHTHSLVFSQKSSQRFLCDFLKLFFCITPSSPVSFFANSSCLSFLNSDLCLLKTVRLLWGLGPPFPGYGLVNASRQKVRLIIEFISFVFLLSGNTILFCWLSNVWKQMFHIISPLFVYGRWRFIQYLLLHHSPKQKSTQGKFSSAFLTQSSFQFNLLLFRAMEKAMAPHSSTFAGKIPWTEEPGGLQFMGSHRVGHD